jgi:hypothetical protein
LNTVERLKIRSGSSAAKALPPITVASSNATAIAVIRTFRKFRVFAIAAPPRHAPM